MTDDIVQEGLPLVDTLHDPYAKPGEGGVQEEHLPQKRGRMVLFMIMMALGAFNNGYAMPEVNQLADLFNVKYHWDTKHEQTIHSSINGSILVAGMALGAFSAGKIMPYGRRKCMIWLSVLGIIGCGITLIQNFYLFNVGRFIYGVANGAQAGVVIRMINEYMPLRWRPTCVGMFSTSQNFASLLAMFSAFILPDNEDTTALEENKTWRIILALPGVIFLLCLLGFLFFFRNDSPRYYVQKGDRENAIRAIHSTYHTNGSDFLAEKQLGLLEAELSGSQSGDDSQKATFKEAFFTDERFKRISWVNFVAMIFHELTAINVVLSYSTTILENIFGKDTEGFNARDGSYMVGLFNFLGAFMSIATMSFFGRRTLFLFGHIGMCTVYVLMGFFTLYNYDMMVLVMMCTFLLVYQNTSGPCAWAYASETCCDVSLGVALLVLYSTVFVLNLITQPLMNSKLNEYGVFWLFGTANFFAIFFVYKFMPETKGKDDAEKKKQFYPGAPWGRKLKEGETEFAGATPNLAEINHRKINGIADTIVSNGSGQANNHRFQKDNMY